MKLNLAFLHRNDEVRREVARIGPGPVSCIRMLAISTLFSGILAPNMVGQSEDVIRLEPLWDRQIDPRWESGSAVGDIEDGITAEFVEFSPDNQLIAAGYGEAECAVVFRTKDMSLVRHLPLFYVEAVEWTSDGLFLMAGGRDEQGRMRVFRASDWELIGSPEVQADQANIEYVDVHGQMVAVAGEDAHVRLYRVTP